jgi:glutathione S-transferase
VGAHLLRLQPNRIAFVACGAIIALACLVAPGLVTSSGSARTRSFIPAAALIRPFAVEQAPEKVLALRSADIEWVREQVQPPDDGRLTPSLCMHLMHLHGTEKETPLPGGARRARLIDVLLNDGLGKKCFGQSVLLQTRHGVRFASDSRSFRAEEAHRDQILAGLAALGIPLSHPVILAGGDFTVGDLLNDSLAEFHLGQAELAWTADAYLHYLPPAKNWSNRFGERFSFDDLIIELLRRPVNGAPCFGMHLIGALTKAARIDSEVHALSPAIRSRLHDLLRRLAADCPREQQSDGSWAFDWYGDVIPVIPRPFDHSTANIPRGRLLMTAHVVEWLQILPSELQVSPGVRRRAALWLLDRLRNAGKPSSLEDFCPNSHAARVILRWATVEPAEESDKLLNMDPKPT